MLPPTKLHHHRVKGSQDNLLTRFVPHGIQRSEMKERVHSLAAD